MISKCLFCSVVAGLFPLMWALAFANRFLLDTPTEMTLWILIPFACIFFGVVTYALPCWPDEED
jgi:hypothetical protein